MVFLGLGAGHNCGNPPDETTHCIGRGGRCRTRICRVRLVLPLAERVLEGYKTIMKDSCLGTSTPAPAGFCEPNRSRVAVAACASYSSSEVEKALTEILESLGGLSTFVRTGQTVLIKPNLFSTHPPLEERIARLRSMKPY